MIKSASALILCFVLKYLFGDIGIPFLNYVIIFIKSNLVDLSVICYAHSTECVLR